MELGFEDHPCVAVARGRERFSVWGSCGCPWLMAGCWCETSDPGKKCISRCATLGAAIVGSEVFRVVFVQGVRYDFALSLPLSGTAGFEDGERSRKGIMSPETASARLQEAQTLYQSSQYIEALSAVDELSRRFPTALPLLALRAQCYANLGLDDDTRAACEVLERHTRRLREDLEAISPAGMAADEVESLRALLVKQDTVAKTIKVKVVAAASAQADKAELEKKLTDLQSQLQQAHRKAEQAHASHEDLKEELDSLRKKESAKAAALESARAQMDSLQETLVQREAAIAVAAREKAEQDELVASLRGQLTELRSQADQMTQSEKQLAHEVELLRAQETSKSTDLERARGELDALRKNLESSEQAIAEATRRSQESEALIESLRGELDTLRTEADTASTAQSALSAELHRLRANEKEKTSALEDARNELESLRTTLVDREKAIASAEARNAENERALTSLRTEVEGLRQQADHASASEKQLADELDELRSKETLKSRTLEQARAELKQMHKELEKREKALWDASRDNSESEDSLKKLEHELEALRKRAEHAAQSEQDLSSEVEQLRQRENAKSTALEDARAELQNLKSALSDREDAVASAAKQSKEHEAKVAQLQGELELIRGRADQAAHSEHALAVELEQLRENGQAMAGQLHAAQAEVERLRQALGQREQAMADAAQTSSESEGVISSLKSELELIKRRSEAASASELALAEELEHLRVNESNKTRSLELAQQEVKALRQALSQQEMALKNAAHGSSQNEQAITSMQDEMRHLRVQAESAAASESALTHELDSLRKTEREKASELKTAQAEVEQLREALGERDKMVERLQKRQEVFGTSRGPSVVRLIATVIVLAAMGGGGYAVWQFAGGKKLGSSPVQDTVSPGASAPLTLTFPADQSIGMVYTQSVDQDGATKWIQHAPAQGIVELPRNVLIRIALDRDVPAAPEVLKVIAPHVNVLDVRAPYANLGAIETLKSFGALQALSVTEGKVSEDFYFAMTDALPKVKLDAEIEPPAPPTAPPARTLAFGGRTLGAVTVRAWDNPAASWQNKGSAQGNVSIPAGQYVRLEVDYDAAADLSPLVALGENGLDYIAMNGRNVTDASLKSLEGMASLKGVIINSPTVTDEGIRALRNLTRIQQLTVRDAQMTDASLLELKRLRQMEYLSLSGVDIADAGLAVLRHFPRLTSLTLTQCGVSNQGLDEIKRLTGLTTLTIQGTRVSREGLSLLQYDLPNCRITGP
ncbi:MAG: hypothetical protein AMXMBFR84_07890 [Candidatus Hydrogenedentota bacterium]